MQRVALGGLAYGLLVKHVPIPKIAAIGRSGTIALAIYLLKPSSQLLQDAGIAAAAIAGASFGETGTVSGDGEDEVLRG
jgi:ABC-type Mn2+/Zn2+ transport system permease subunit